MSLSGFAVLIKAYERRTKTKLSLKTYKGVWRLDRRGDQGVFIMSDTLRDLADALHLKVKALP